jgi:hypothetical protein
MSVSTDLLDAADDGSFGNDDPAWKLYEDSPWDWPPEVGDYPQPERDDDGTDPF